MVASVRLEAPRLAALVKAMEDGGQTELRKEFAKSLRKTTEEVLRAEKAAVMGLSSKAKHTAKQKARFAATELGRKKQININQFDKAVQNAGLRQSIANSIGRIIRYRGKDVGVRVRAQSSKMPPGMGKLPRHTNRGKWGHPFLGHRDIWVDQTTTPAGWWELTGRREYPKVRADIEQVIKEYEKKILKAAG